MTEDALKKHLRVPSPYEKMVLHGLYASFTGKETRMLMEDQDVRMYVPQTLPPVSHKEVATMEVAVAYFSADRIDAGRWKIRGSLRPWDVESWVWVGRIN